MGHISPKYLDNIREGTVNSQATIDQSTVPTTETVSTIKNKTDAVTGEQHVQIGGRKR